MDLLVYYVAILVEVVVPVTISLWNIDEVHALVGRCQWDWSIRHKPVLYVLSYAIGEQPQFVFAQYFERCLIRRCCEAGWLSWCSIAYTNRNQGLVLSTLSEPGLCEHSVQRPLRAVRRQPHQVSLRVVPLRLHGRLHCLRDGIGACRVWFSSCYGTSYDLPDLVYKCWNGSSNEYGTYVSCVAITS